jgi:hypothetical protein
VLVASEGRRARPLNQVFDGYLDVRLSRRTAPEVQTSLRSIWVCQSAAGKFTTPSNKGETHAVHTRIC